MMWNKGYMKEKTIGIKEKENKSKKLNVVLSIAGSDCSGGAGIQADVKTMCAHQVYGMTAITALTAQNTLGVSAVAPVTKKQLEEQLDSCLSDISADAIKIGMLPNKELMFTVIQKLKDYKGKNIVLDPVMISSSGKKLMDINMVEQMERELFPMCTVITPNIIEAEFLSGEQIKRASDMEMVAEKLWKKYGCAVLLKGGHFQNKHLSGEEDESEVSYATDILYSNDGMEWFEEKRIENKNTHGTGCTLSSAIASNLALGYPLNEAVKRGKGYVTKVISERLDLGHGVGPMNHMICLNGIYD